MSQTISRLKSLCTSQFVAWFFYGVTITLPFLVLIIRAFRPFDWFSSKAFLGMILVKSSILVWWVFIAAVFSIAMYYFFRDKVIRFLIALLVICLPFVFDADIYSVFTMPKLFTLRLFTFFILIIWAYKIYCEGFYRFISSKLNRWLLIYGVISIITVLFSTQVWASVLGIHGRFIGIFTLLNFLFLTFLIFNTFYTRRHIRHLILISFLTALGTAIYGLGVNMEWWGTTAIWTQDPTQRLFASLGHSNHFGAYLVFHFMIGLSFLFYYRRWWLRILLGATEIIFFYAILETASRGALVALTIGFLVFLVFLFRLKWKFFWRHKIKFAAGIFILGVLLFFTRGPLIDRIKQLKITERTVSTINFMLEGHKPDRVSWWWTSLDMFKDSPILGHGFGTYKDIYNQYRRLDYQVPGNIQDTITPESAHMEYFNTLATQGALGFLSYLAIIVFFLWQMGSFIWRKAAKKPERYLALGILTAVVSYLSQVLISFGVISTLASFYLFIGLGIALVNANQDEPSMPQKTAFNGYRYLVAAAIILIAITSLVFATKQYQAEFHLRLAQAAFNTNKPEIALYHYHKVTDLMPREPFYYSELADHAIRVVSESTDEQNPEDIFKRLEESEKAYLKSIEISPLMPHVHANLALNYKFQKDTSLQISAIFTQKSEAEKDPILKKQYQNESQKYAEKAQAFHKKCIQTYEKAIELGPNNPLYNYTLGVIYFKSEEYQTAIDYFGIARQIRHPVKDEVLYLAYASLRLGDIEQAENWQRNIRVTDKETKLYGQFLNELAAAKQAAAESADLEAPPAQN